LVYVASVKLALLSMCENQSLRWGLQVPLGMGYLARKQMIGYPATSVGFCRIGSAGILTGVVENLIRSIWQKIGKAGESNSPKNSSQKASSNSLTARATSLNFN